MIGFREVSWLTLAVALSACTADVPRSSQDAVAPDTVSVAQPAAETQTAQGEPGSIASQTDAPPGVEILTADGWGPLRIGMTVPEITAALGPDANPDAVGGPDPDQCDEFRPKNAPEGVLVMVQRGVLTRISVSRNTEIRTPEGFRVGDPEAGVLAAYGSRARIEPHQYQASPAKYITVWQEPRAANPRGIRYEIDSDGNIAHLRGGGPSIEAVEGCV